MIEYNFNKKPSLAGIGNIFVGVANHDYSYTDFEYPSAIVTGAKIQQRTYDQWRVWKKTKKDSNEIFNSDKKFMELVCKYQ